MFADDGATRCVAQVEADVGIATTLMTHVTGERAPIATREIPDHHQGALLDAGHFTRTALQHQDQRRVCEDVVFAAVLDLQEIGILEFFGSQLKAVVGVANGQRHQRERRAQKASRQIVTRTGFRAGRKHR